MVRRRKQRSLRGRLLIALLYIVLFCIFVLVTRPILNNISKNSTSNGEYSKGLSNNKIYDVSKLQSNEFSYEKERLFVSKLLSIVGKVGYLENGTWEVGKDGKVTSEGIDSFGLVELAYYIADSNDLKNKEVSRDNISSYTEIERDSLRIGDVGICELPEGPIYGVCVGNYGSFPLFVYASMLPSDMYSEGGVYVSYDKNICNDLFAGMYPIPYDKYVRLPGIEYHSEIGAEHDQYLTDVVIPSLSYSMYASAAYRIGEWFRTKDATLLVSRMNSMALEEKGLYLDVNHFNEYVNSYSTYLGHDDFVYLINSYTQFDNYTIVSAEIVLIGKDDKMFTKTGLYFNATIYEDGSYLPAPEMSLTKYSHLYGIKQIIKGIQDASEDKLLNNGYNGYTVDIDSIFEDDVVEQE